MPRLALLLTALTALTLCAASCATVPREKLYPGTAALLPGTEADMNSPGYWIARHPDPDGLLLDADGVDALNAAIRGRKLTRDLGTLPARTGDEVRKELSDTVSWLSRAKVYQRNGKRARDGFFAPLVRDQNANGLPGTVAYRYGFVVRRSDMRVLPTREPLYDGPGDAFVDNLQASSLERGTPVAVMHESADGSWLYATTELVSGWLSADDVAFTDPDSFFARYRRSDPLVVTAARADLFADEGKTRFLGYVRMGAFLYRSEASDSASRPGVLRVSLFTRDEGGTLAETVAWIDARDVSDGFLPYTPRTVYQQAFKLLHAPYGWGGGFGERDCSQFLCEIFSTVGIVIPRNSSRQAMVGRPVDGFSADVSEVAKKDLLANGAVPGATLLRFPGHIMLYLGDVNGEPYAIHATWGYRERRGLSDVTRLVNRVAVSTLGLGDGSKAGSHLSRLTSAAVVTLPPEREAEDAEAGSPVGAAE